MIERIYTPFPVIDNAVHVNGSEHGNQGNCKQGATADIHNSGRNYQQEIRYEEDQTALDKHWARQHTISSKQGKRKRYQQNYQAMSAG